MGKLVGKEEIMKYARVGKAALKDAIERAEFPHFYVGGKMCSTEEAIDRWFLAMATECCGVRIGDDEKDSGKGDGDEV